MITTSLVNIHHLIEIPKKKRKKNSRNKTIYVFLVYEFLGSTLLTSFMSIMQQG